MTHEGVPVSGHCQRTAAWLKNSRHFAHAKIGVWDIFNHLHTDAFAQIAQSASDIDDRLTALSLSWRSASSRCPRTSGVE
jgi:hypothetical protein